MQLFNLQSNFKPTGDQPQAIAQLTKNIVNNKQFQTLVGVTGSGKTFTIANVIQNINKPVLIISHNKTLTAQLYQEFRDFFPNNGVHYFVSYYDYYQPEAYIPQRDLYIEKDASVNEEIDKLRLAATTALLTRKDVIVVASVSSIYNIGSPTAFRNQVKILKVGDTYNIMSLSKLLVNLLYERNDFDLKRGTFRVRNSNIDIYLAYTDIILRIKLVPNLQGQSIIHSFEFLNAVDFTRIDKASIKSLVETVIELKEDKILSIGLYPAKHYVIPPDVVDNAINNILKDMEQRVIFFKKHGKELEAQRIKQKVLYDVQMIQEMGYCKGIENYSVYFDGRSPGEPPYSLFDYFPEDYLLIIDESHMTIPQIRGMFNGDYARKKMLVDYGFRLPTAFDNRPLQFSEFEARMGYTIFMSATPADYEIQKTLNSAGKQGIVEQLIRPTGIVDPEIKIRPAKSQVQDLLQEIEKVVKNGDRVLVITLTKRMSEELTAYLEEQGIRVKYLHSDIKTLERSDILTALRQGDFDVLVGINLLREGLDLPEVKLVAILDADKQGFLRSTTSLIQIMGRAARHVQGYVILYADSETPSIRQAVSEVKRRRKKQLQYNKKHNITPVSIKKEIRASILPHKHEKDPDVREKFLQAVKGGILESNVFMSGSDVSDIDSKGPHPGYLLKSSNDIQKPRKLSYSFREILENLAFKLDPAILEDLSEKTNLQALLIELGPLIKAYKVASKTKQLQIKRDLRKIMKSLSDSLEFEKAILVREIIKQL